MKLKPLLFILIISVLYTCGKYSIKTEIEKSKGIREVKKAGLVLRFSPGNKITIKDQARNISKWFGGYKPIKNIDIIESVSEKVNYYEQDNERFYQRLLGDDIASTKRGFLKYKSIGLISLFINENKAELKKTLTEGNFDCLIFYEVYSVISGEMQLYDFETVIVITDKDLNVIYLDHQSNDFDSPEFDIEKIKEQLMDKVSERLLHTLEDLDFLEKE